MRCLETKITSVKDSKRNRIVWIKEMKMIHLRVHKLTKLWTIKIKNLLFYNKLNNKIIFYNSLKTLLQN